MVSCKSQVRILKNALNKKKKELHDLRLCKPITVYEKKRFELFHMKLLSTKQRWEKRILELEIKKKRKFVKYPAKSCRIKETYLPFVC